MSGLDLVAVGDIGVIVGVKVDTIHKWIARHDDFPTPVAVTSAGAIYLRCEVEEWLRRTGRSGA